MERAAGGSPPWDDAPDPRRAGGPDGWSAARGPEAADSWGILPVGAHSWSVLPVGGASARGTPAGDETAGSTPIAGTPVAGSAVAGSAAGGTPVPGGAVAGGAAGGSAAGGTPVPGGAAGGGADPGRPARPARPAGHRGRRRLIRRPLAWAVLLAGLAAVAGGTVGLIRLTSHARDVARPLTRASAAPRGIFAAPPLPRAGRRASRPVALVIPAIGVRTSLVKLGRTAQGTLQTPSSTTVAGWYTASPRPGEIGSAIIAGHIDSYLGPGVFFRLGLLHPGDLVYVRQADGSLAVFRVYAEHTYAKAHFPTQQVYGPEPDAELHLITCGGGFDSATRSYLSNVVVYSVEIGHHPARRQHHPPRRAHQPRSRHS